ncbi:MAG: NAD(P)/FAD-dependent oxidoreductase [Coxiellaceae bacterium]|nr:NAD(P)/FAD-dependent oxidoreductase [Coxiellaceae bacterium]
MNNYDVIIIGAGAAGLMCAFEAGKRGRRVLVLDSANKPGKKILMSGGGRCNFTNMNVSDDNFTSHNAKFCKSALSRYTPWHFIDWVKASNIPFHEKTLGQLFCDNKSKDILNMLLNACDTVKAAIQLKTNVTKITQHTDGGFTVETSRDNYRCESLVIATGGLSIPTLGSSPFGYKVAEQFGIKVWPTRAGLVPFTLHNHDKEKFASLSGVSVDCIASCNGHSFRENLLFTHRGLSGPAMLQISSYWQPGDTLTITLHPDVSLFEQLQSAQAQQPKLLLKNCLHQWLPKSVVSVWLNDTTANTPLHSFSHKQFQAIADQFQRWQIKPNGTEGYRTAEVTLGGVDCDAISSKTFEANSTAGLYFIGEVLDVSGWLGGYNFQWAWASGHAAGSVC